MATVLATMLLGAGCPAEPELTVLPPLPPRVEAPGLGAPGPTRPVKRAVIAFTGEVRGEVEACGCPTVPYGGFARRARLLDDLRAEGVPLFVVDVGELLVKGLDRGDVADRPERARAVLDLSRRVGLDAWAPGASDLLPAGLGLLSGTDALSATWRTGDGQPVLPAATVIERDGVRLGLIGLSGPARGLDSADAVGAVRDARQGDADAWIVLSNAPEATTRAVAEQVEGLGAVLSVRGDRHDAPRATSGAPIIETPDRGRYVTLVRLALATEPGPWSLVEGGVWDEVARLRTRAAHLPTEAARAASKTRLIEAEARLDAEVAGHAVAWVEDRPLGSDLDGPSSVDDRLATFKESSVERARDRADRPPVTAGYATGAACLSCHDKRVLTWGYDGHARAHEALVTRRAAEDPECLPCHTTAWGEPGGNASTSGPALRTWKAVQCEACHGPLAGHPSPDVRPQPVSEATCRRCHDEANSPQFDYTAYLARISCTQVSNEERAAGR